MEPGDRFDVYELVELLGEGGMGVVWKAQNPLLGRSVALKILHMELGAKPEQVERFLREARAINAIQHENIVNIEELRQAPSGPYYYTMELLQGGTLRAHLQQERRLAPEAAVSITTQVASAAGAAHQQGIVHRDLKPENIFLTERQGRSDFVKVLDFGIAKLTGREGGGMPSRTRTGALLGTPEYMSPEQISAKGEIDHRTDIYALGVVLFEMVVGRPPFQGAFADLLDAHRFHPPPRPSDLGVAVPAALEAAVLKALEKRPGDRFASMAELAGALGARVEAPARAAPDVVVRPSIQPRPAPSSPAGPMGTVILTTQSGSAGQIAAPPTPPAVPAVSAPPGAGRKLWVAAAGGVAVAAAAAVWLWPRLQWDSSRPVPAGAGGVPVVVLPPISPDAGRPPPPPDATPPVQKTVTLQLRSTPRVVTVRAADGTDLGRTPKNLVMPREQAVTLVFSKKGYEDQRIDLVPTEDGPVKVKLKRRRRPPRPPTPPPPQPDKPAPPVSDNPFDNK